MNPKKIKIYIKNLFGHCCLRLVERELKTHGLDIVQLKPGQIIFNSFNEDKDTKLIYDILSELGMSVIQSKDERIVLEIKQAVYELIFEMNNVDSIAKKSEYLVEKLGMNYQYLSKLFSKLEPITLEKYIIQQKIERIKQLVIEDEYSMSEIAYMMDYSSVQYLSGQFKKETGMTLTEFKNRFYR